MDRLPGWLKCSVQGLLFLAVLGLIVGAGLLLFWRPLLVGLGQFLIVDDTPPQADFIYVLNSDIHTRPLYAARLYNQGVASKIVIARVRDSATTRSGLMPNITDLSVQVMLDNDVDPADIELLTDFPVSSTYEEMLVLREYLRQESADEVIVLTTGFHTRRARWIMDRGLTGLPVRISTYAAPHNRFDHTNWWESEEGFLYAVNEYLKLGYYMIQYRNPEPSF